MENKCKAVREDGVLGYWCIGMRECRHSTINALGNLCVFFSRNGSCTNPAAQAEALAELEGENV